MSDLTLESIERLFREAKRLPEYFIDLTQAGGETKVFAVTLPDEHRGWLLPGYPRGAVLAQAELFYALQAEGQRQMAARGLPPPGSAPIYSFPIMLVTAEEALYAFGVVWRLLHPEPASLLVRQTLPVETRPLPSLDRWFASPLPGAYLVEQPEFYRAPPDPGKTWTPPEKFPDEPNGE